MTRPRPATFAPEDRVVPMTADDLAREARLELEIAADLVDSGRDPSGELGEYWERASTTHALLAIDARLRTLVDVLLGWPR